MTVVLDGARRGYREAVAAMEPLDVDSAPTAFHEWRKRVKDHWYDIRLFEGVNAGGRPHVDTIRTLEQWLGDDHDLAVLRAILLEGDDRYGTARTRTLVLGSILKRQTSLRRRALALSHRSFTQSDKTFARSLARWWRER